MFREKPVTVTDALYERTLSFLVAAAFALPIASLSMRLPLRGGSLKQILAPLAVHVPCAVLYCFVFATVLNVLGRTVGRMPFPLWRGVLFSVSAYRQGQLTFYFFILGLTLAVRYHREARARAEEKALLSEPLPGAGRGPQGAAQSPLPLQHAQRNRGACPARGRGRGRAGDREALARE